MPRRLLLAALLTLAFPASAQAASVSVSGGVLTYTATPGDTNAIALAETAPGTVTVTPQPGDNDSFGAGTGCTPNGTGDTCTGVTSVSVDAGDGNDTIAAGGLATISATLNGNLGNDTLTGGADDDVLEGGDGNDTLNGGNGDDTLAGDAGADVLNGGDGIDTADYGTRTTPSYTIDGVANDGPAGEGDDIEPDVENIRALTAATDTISITGNGAPNRLVVTQGKATIVGGSGSDELEGGPQDDAIDARDGTQDVVVCGGGTDTALVDTVDVVSPTCENVQRSATAGGVDDDHPPALQWSAPKNRAKVSGDSPATLIVTATDDRGVALVEFYDDDRKLCTVTAAPYACAYHPTGGDVGRNTVRAVAVDAAGQSATVVRVVNVLRFRPRGVSIRAAGRVVSGRISRPARVTSGQGCHGTVTVTAKAGGRTLARRKVGITHKCTYRARLGHGSRARATARFNGNAVLRAGVSKGRALPSG
jgi:Bacterial Ig domain/RTX calcium-binding nonapeptide repeat (4 copies)